jgi:hypothetical protein
LNVRRCLKKWPKFEGVSEIIPKLYVKNERPKNIIQLAHGRKDVIGGASYWSVDAGKLLLCLLALEFLVFFFFKKKTRLKK